MSMMLKKGRPANVMVRRKSSGLSISMVRLSMN